jgi:hypothetical protein
VPEVLEGVRGRTRNREVPQVRVEGDRANLQLGEQEMTEESFKATFANAKLLDMFSKAGDAVLLVCEMFSRRWVGFEIDPKKFDEAVKLIRSVCP